MATSCEYKGDCHVKALQQRMPNVTAEALLRISRLIAHPQLSKPLRTAAPRILSSHRLGNLDGKDVANLSIIPIVSSTGVETSQHFPDQLLAP